MRYERQAKAVVPIVLVLGLAYLTGSVLDAYVDPLFIWGGSVCDTVGDMRACTGYLPAGLMILVLVWWGVFAAAVTGLSKLNEIEDP